MSIHALPRHHAGRKSVVLLHCSGSGGRQWDPVIHRLAPRYEVLAPDLLGYASQAAWSVGSPASLNDEAQALAPLLDARPGGVHLVGHSYGGAVALQMALRWPSRVRSLTLYEPVRFALLCGDPDTADIGEAVVSVGRRIGMTVLSGRHQDAAAQFVDYWSGDGAWDALPPARREALAARMPKVQAEFEALFADRAPIAAYDRLEMPVRLIRGDRSPAPGRMVVGRLGWRLPQAETVTLAGMGHMAPVTHADRFMEALPRWLQPEAEALAA